MMMTFDCYLMRLQIALSLLGYQEICQDAILIDRKGKMLISNLLIVVVFTKLFDMIEVLYFLEINVIGDPHIF
jgi:hypothetical protein